ncbi:MAG: ATP phosphoribosyltransferase [Spirochaetaceae bacterium]|jgi:ATP phosphoribosyltransferase|nr:ATP phosphoribosyltransferase [Spirochaetaceae bacterium]
MALRLLIPKGRIYDSIARLLNEAGFPIRSAERTYRPALGVEWLDAKIMKPQNVGELLEIGSHDAGFTGIDWIQESGAQVEEVLDLGFDRVRIVAAIPSEEDEQQLKKRKIVVATEYVRLAENYLKTNGYDYRIVRTYGATEVFPPDDADMIIDNTASGQTLRENGLKIIATLLTSSTRFFASRQALACAGKRQQIDELGMLFRAVLEGRGRVMLEMNAGAADYERLIAAVPAMRFPTVMPLHSGGGAAAGYAIKIAVQRTEVPELLPRLKQLGATDIVEYDLRKVMP